MSELELTKRCAEAMGLTIESKQLPDASLQCMDGHRRVWYWPLTDDAQAMALVKKFLLGITPPQVAHGTWAVSGDCGGSVGYSLNRAIVECVAKLQQGQ